MKKIYALSCILFFILSCSGSNLEVYSDMPVAKHVSPSEAFLEADFVGVVFVDKAEIPSSGGSVFNAKVIDSFKGDIREGETITVLNTNLEFGWYTFVFLKKELRNFTGIGYGWIDAVSVIKFDDSEFGRNAYKNYLSKRNFSKYHLGGPGRKYLPICDLKCDEDCEFQYQLINYAAGSIK